ncbi:MAG: flagellar assembly protein FliH, partial [Spirochaetales bacterium]|nr:flagellar assembly protein FliH [Spirochaetales bacterium]
MARNVFRPTEVMNMTLSRKVRIEAPVFETEEPVDLMEEYTGPTADDLRREAEAFKEHWEQEKAQMYATAQAEVEKIREEAEKSAFEEVKKKTDAAQVQKQQADAEVERIMEQARADAAQLVEDANRRVSQIETDAQNAGYEAGRKEGFDEGKAEVERLVDRLHVILDGAIEKRNDIIEEAESQLIDLVLLISQKVVKVISDNQKNVVINNVVQALRKLKSRGNVAIHVNLADLELATDNVNNFINMVENVQSITVLEDTTVDKGGCIIETDFGQIDARVSSQLKEIEESILELAPIRVKGES